MDAEAVARKPRVGASETRGALPGLGCLGLSGRGSECDIKNGERGWFEQKGPSSFGRGHYSGCRLARIRRKALARAKIREWGEAENLWIYYHLLSSTIIFGLGRCRCVACTTGVATIRS
jgi:hypothetical protein